MKEIWKDIKEYEGLYKISNKGNVKSFVRKVKKLTPSITKNGYLNVGLFLDKKKTTKLVHHLVWDHFGYVNRNNTVEIDHINGIKSDNRIDNLQLLTHQENINKYINSKRFQKEVESLISQYESNDIHKKSLIIKICALFQKNLY